MTNSDHPRAVREGLQYQGPTEVVAYSIDTAGEGGSPTQVTVDVTSAADDYVASVKEDVMPDGSPAVAGDVIILPHLRNLTPGETYRVLVTFTIDGNQLTRFIPVHCQ